MKMCGLSSKQLIAVRSLTTYIRKFPNSLNPVLWQVCSSPGVILMTLQTDLDLKRSTLHLRTAVLFFSFSSFLFVYHCLSISLLISFSAPHGMYLDIFITVSQNFPFHWKLSILVGTNVPAASYVAIENLKSGLENRNLSLS